MPKNIVNQAAQPPIHRIAMKPRMPVLFEIDVRHGDWEREHRQVGHSSERLADSERDGDDKVRLHDDERHAPRSNYRKSPRKMRQHLVTVLRNQHGFAETHTHQSRHAQYAMRMERHSWLENIVAPYRNLDRSLDP